MLLRILIAIPVGLLLVVGIARIIVALTNRQRRIPRCEIDSAQRETERWDALSDEALYNWESKLDSSWEGDTDV